jgi:hypothetical protein
MASTKELGQPFTGVNQPSALARARGLLFAPSGNLAVSWPVVSSCQSVRNPLVQSVRDLAKLTRLRARDALRNVRQVRQTIDRARERLREMIGKDSRN